MSASAEITTSTTMAPASTTVPAGRDFLTQVPSPVLDYIFSFFSWDETLRDTTVCKKIRIVVLRNLSGDFDVALRGLKIIRDFTPDPTYTRSVREFTVYPSHIQRPENVSSDPRADRYYAALRRMESVYTSIIPRALGIPARTAFTHGLTWDSGCTNLGININNTGPTGVNTARLSATIRSLETLVPRATQAQAATVPAPRDGATKTSG